VADDKNTSRLVEIDALRGLAALAVVLFHYTTRFAELFGANPPPSISFPDGHYGVNLFFIISGFVIFMTLEKTSRPMDFVISRFSRLFPAYWIAIILTFVITHLLGLPGKLVDITTAIGNLIMIHGLFKIPHVDGVYWTLEVELLFYGGMFLLYRFGRLHLIHHALLGLLALRLTYHVLASRFGIDLPWTIYRLLILQYIPWFALGISIYLATSRHDAGAWRRPAFTATCAILTLLIVDALFVAALAVALGAAVTLAASGRASLLRHRTLVWLGSISYPLYLLHENIGWSLQLRLGKLGVSTDLTILIVLASSLAMATALTRWVEQPAMRWIRSTYRSRMAAAR
jgi:peptidoglycan/LPS O-acetylase OafA/YrhL